LQNQNILAVPSIDVNPFSVVSGRINFIAAESKSSWSLSLRSLAVICGRSKDDELSRYRPELREIFFVEKPMAKIMLCCVTMGGKVPKCRFPRFFKMPTMTEAPHPSFYCWIAITCCVFSKVSGSVDSKGERLKTSIAALPTNGVSYGQMSNLVASVVTNSEPMTKLSTLPTI
jgi:hypothetical protein